MRILRALLAIVFVFVMFAVAFAAEDSEIGRTVDWLWMLLVKLAGLVVIWMIGLVLAKLKKKYGIELNEKQAAMIENGAMLAIGYAEEWARKRIDIDKMKVKSEEKFSKAVKKLCEKVPILTEEKAREIIVSNLPKFRALVDSKIGN